MLPSVQSKTRYLLI